MEWGLGGSVNPTNASCIASAGFCFVCGWGGGRVRVELTHIRHSYFNCLHVNYKTGRMRVELTHIRHSYFNCLHVNYKTGRVRVELTHIRHSHLNCLHVNYKTALPKFQTVPKRLCTSRDKNIHP